MTTLGDGGGLKALAAVCRIIVHDGSRRVLVKIDSQQQWELLSELKGSSSVEVADVDV